MKVCGGIFYEFLNQNLLYENKFTEILHCVAKEERLKKNLHYTFYTSINMYLLNSIILQNNNDCYRVKVGHNTLPTVEILSGKNALAWGLNVFHVK